MATKNPLMGRVLDIAHADSLALNILGPRSFTAEELLLLTGDVATLEGFLMVLGQDAFDSVPPDLLGWREHGKHQDDLSSGHLYFG